MSKPQVDSALLQDIRNSYEEVNYVSYPFQASHPQTLKTLGMLFKMKPSPAHLDKMRVLELGCASGGNLIPLASDYTRAEFVGIDLSQKQVEAGQKIIAGMGLKNITLKHLSILDVDAQMGKFDYIIAHGVYSWVPRVVQDKIFEILQNHLEPHGIGYISHNVLPGWNSLRTIREMILYHVRDLPDMGQKLAQARALMTFMQETLKGFETEHAKNLCEEIKQFALKEDYYLAHELLEIENEQIYFYEFMDRAKHYGLQFLGDSELSSMYLGNLPTKVQEALQQSQDIIKTEQYKDFVCNRRFRMTLLCQRGVQLNRSVSPSDLDVFSLTTGLVLKTPATFDPSQESGSWAFGPQGREDVSVTINHLETAATFVALSEAKTPLTPKEVAKAALEKLGNNKKYTLAALQETFLSIAIRLALSSSEAIKLHSDPGRFASVIPEKPKALSFPLFMARHGVRVLTNAHHQPVSFDAFNALAFSYFDGTRPVDDVLELIDEEHIKTGHLNLEVAGEKITDHLKIKENVRPYLERMLRQALANKLLAA